MVFGALLKRAMRAEDSACNGERTQCQQHIVGTLHNAEFPSRIVLCAIMEPPVQHQRLGDKKNGRKNRLN